MSGPALRKLKFRKREGLFGGASKKDDKKDDKKDNNMENKTSKKLNFRKLSKFNKKSNSDEPVNNSEITSNEKLIIEPKQPVIKLSKPLKSSKPEGPIQFGKDGFPVASKENLDRMTMDEASKFCDEWTVDKHLNRLLVELADYVEISQSKPKAEKCQAILQYKKEYPSGAQMTKITNKKYETTYESFNWRPETSIGYRGKNWTLQHAPNFRSEITSMYNEFMLTDKEISLNRLDVDDPMSPFKYQAVVSNYLNPKTPYRGLLAFHGLGSGKSKTAVMTSTNFLKDGKKVLVLTPGALREKFIQELFLWGSQEHGVGIKDYRKLSDRDRIDKEKVARKAIKFYYDILTYNEKGVYFKLKELANPESGMLEDRLIIVDEIHNLVSRMSKVTNISRQVYHFLMERVSNCKMLFLSGTPLLNNPYELGVMLNLIRGKFKTKSGTFTLYPENEEEFNEKFVDIYDKSVINKNLFILRSSGAVSYYGGSTDRKGMPEEVIHPINMMDMSNHQFKLYLQERFNETRKERKGKSGTVRNIDEATGSAFRTYSRMICNFSFPDGIVRPKPISARDFRTYQKYADRSLDSSQLDLDDIMDEIDPSKLEGFKDSTAASSKKSKSKSKFPGSVDDDSDDELMSGKEKTLTKKEREETYAKLLTEALIELENMKGVIFQPENLKIYSPKMAKIMDNIKNGPGNQGLVYIYTEFRILEGVRIMGSVLQYNGYEKIDYTGINSFDDFKAKYPAGNLRYGIISSEEDSKQRRLLIEIYNHSENAHGEYVKVIMGTSASSEGIDLMRTTQIHIMEPYWNMVRNNQVIGRGVRFGSHLDLPLDEQVVNVFSYQMRLTEAQIKEAVELMDNPKESKSTDQHIHNLAMMKDHINSQFIKMLKESSIDCALNYLVNIKKNSTMKCFDVPSDRNNYLYLPDINQDAMDDEYSRNLKYEEYKVGSLNIKGVEYGYKVNPNNGRPMMDPPYVTHEGKIYHQVITLFDLDLLNNGVEIKQKYYPIGTKILIDV